ncbi:MAG: RluA family pseudouridine synthase, partial [Oscillospiraceae bacterium]
MKNSKNNIEFEVKEKGELLDSVRRELSGMPAGKVKSLLEHRLISVDGVVTSKYNFPLKPGQIISVKQTVGKSYHSPLQVIYEDEDLLAVDKPANLLSVSTDTEKERTAFRMLLDAGMGPLYIVHRLDRETSGVLLFAKSAEMCTKLQHDWQETRRREYIAICEGVFEEKSGRCDSLLRETESHLVYSVSSGEGKRAITNYEVLRENSKYSYLRVNIETGRKNQIRVHMKDLGHPVVGDKKYGAKGSPLGRLGLHAGLLEITHPRTGEQVVIKAAPERKLRLPTEVAPNRRG